MDSAGRLVIPKEIRRQAGIKAGMPLEVHLRERVIEIEPAPIKTLLEKRGRLVVAVPEESVPPLTVDTVGDTRRRVRQARGTPD